MIRLAAFGDEIAADLDEQLSTMAALGIRHLDMRAAWGIPVLRLEDTQIERLRASLLAHNAQIAAIASPIGKQPIDAPFHEQVDMLERAITLAQTYGARYIRIFSYYPPASAEGPVDPASYRDEVLRRLRELTARARAANVVLVHENEKDIYGDTILRCVDLLAGIDDPHFRAVFDPANFIQCNQMPYPDGYTAIAPWLAYVHVKDALADGSVVPAGEGAARWPELLTRLRIDGYDGILSLEPHLAAAGRYAGFSGPRLFEQAAQALQEMLRQIGWEYR